MYRDWDVWSCPVGSWKAAQARMRLLSKESNTLWMKHVLNNCGRKKSRNEKSHYTCARLGSSFGESSSLWTQTLRVWIQHLSLDCTVIPFGINRSLLLACIKSEWFIGHNWDPSFCIVHHCHFEFIKGCWIVFSSGDSIVVKCHWQF